MHCVHCQTDDFNRVILDLEKRSVVGGLCEMCESSLRSGGISKEQLLGSLPMIDDAEPRYAAPRLDLVVSDPDEGEFYLEYTFDSSTPTLGEMEHASPIAKSREFQSA